MEFENENLPIQIHPSATTQSLPTEVVLLILESFVAQAFEDAWPVALTVREGPVPLSDCRFRIAVDYTSPQRGDSLQERFIELIQTPVSINKHSRAAARKHFVPYPMKGNSIPVLGWVCPSIDRFKFMFDDQERVIINMARHNVVDLPTTSKLQRAIENPSPVDVEMLHSMQIAHGYPFNVFSESSHWAQTDLDLVFSLPNLRELHIDAGVKNYGLDDFYENPSSYEGLRPIDSVTFPDLAEANFDEGGVFERCARKAEEKGAKIFGVEQRSTTFPRKFMELLWTPEGTRMKFIPPEKLHEKHVPLYDSDGVDLEDEALHEKHGLLYDSDRDLYGPCGYETEPQLYDDWDFV